MGDYTAGRIFLLFVGININNVIRVDLNEGCFVGVFQFFSVFSYRKKKEITKIRENTAKPLQNSPR